MTVSPSNLDILGLNHLGEGLLDPQSRESGGRVVRPAFRHELQNCSETFIAVPSIGHNWPQTFDTHDLTHIFI